MRISDWSSDVCSSDLVKDVDARRWTMLNVPSFVCEPARDGSRSEAAVIIDTRNRICLVAGRADYCGVVKKTIFTVGNYLLPLQGRLSMHCSANVGKNNDAAILFGLSGTGKRSEEHTSELQSLMRISYAVFCLKKKNIIKINVSTH